MNNIYSICVRLTTLWQSNCSDRWLNILSRDTYFLLEWLLRNNIFRIIRLTVHFILSFTNIDICKTLQMLHFLSFIGKSFFLYYTNVTLNNMCMDMKYYLWQKTKNFSCSERIVIYFCSRHMYKYINHYDRFFCFVFTYWYVFACIHK